jgi:hypothetical protein
MRPVELGESLVPGTGLTLIRKKLTRSGGVGGCGNGFCGDFESELVVTFEVKDGEHR